jgi:hypothetical protein
MYLLASHKKGISSVQAAKDLGVTQKTAWFMLHRIREMAREKEHIVLNGIVEMDETPLCRKSLMKYFLQSERSTGMGHNVLGLGGRFNAAKPLL